tara:strand:+ start:3770 stop:3958 length:189 start_codon:yes stop_codon:yes gene_type:complete
MAVKEKVTTKTRLSANNPSFDAGIKIAAHINVSKNNTRVVYEKADFVAHRKKTANTKSKFAM